MAVSNLSCAKSCIALSFRILVEKKFALGENISHFPSVDFARFSCWQYLARIHFTSTAIAEMAFLHLVRPSKQRIEDVMFIDLPKWGLYLRRILSSTSLVCDTLEEDNILYLVSAKFCTWQNFALAKLENLHRNSKTNNQQLCWHRTQICADMAKLSQKL